MKKIIKPAEREEAVYYSDFSGKSFGECPAPVTLLLQFNYGSDRDGASLELHLDDEDVKPLVDLIKSKLSVDIKAELKKRINKQQKDFDDSMQFRDWGSCDYLTNSMWFLRELLDIKDE
jgi:hypothetical protein